MSRGGASNASTCVTPALRWPVPANLAKTLGHPRIEKVERRGKYLLFETVDGWLIVHLGMTGTLRVLLQRAASARRREARPHRSRLRRIHPALSRPAPLRSGALARTRRRRCDSIIRCSRVSASSRSRRSSRARCFSQDARAHGLGETGAARGRDRRGRREYLCLGEPFSRRYPADHRRWPPLARALRPARRCRPRHARRLQSPSGGSTLRDFVGSNGESGLLSARLLRL